ncbi:alpha/beta fold hydrolase [Cytobacillus praedii]|uniref:alpha/beta fold hydrolase n=1 Tax=Cytobacillus praedii TaxID=1742358 RepID=UPI003AF74924
MWKKVMLETSRGRFEIFICGEGSPLCVTHLYSEYSELGNYFADVFVEKFQVFLINLKEAGNSCKAEVEEELSMLESCKDLEAIRVALHIDKWSFAGHSTGGMLGLMYAINYPSSLIKILVGGAAASNKYMEHEGSMYSVNSPLNERLIELFSIMKSSESTKEDRIKANREWTEMSLYHPIKFNEYFSKPSSGRVVRKRLEYYSYQELPNYNIIDLLSEVSTPAIIYCGKYDTQCPLTFSEEIHRYMSESKMYVFNYSNHVPYIEEQRLFLEMINEFEQL